MVENLIDKVREYIDQRQGQDVEVNNLRKELKIDPVSKAWESIHVVMHRLSEEKKIRPSGRKDGVYHVIKQVRPIQVFGERRERRPPFDLVFPRDFDKGIQMDFAENIVVREGDLITIGGVKSKGKTALCLNFCAENADKRPVLMGNEYSVLISHKIEVEGQPPIIEERFEPAPRFLDRLDSMSEYIQWVDDKGYDKFTLLPVRDDYPEHIVPDRINIIDWINIDAGKAYDIGRVLESIKGKLGRGIGIVALQKSELAGNPRGGQFVRDFSDVEILLDGFGRNDDDILLTLKGVKEKTKPIVGKTYAYTIGGKGTTILNFREVKKCPACHGSGEKKGADCEECYGRKYIDA